MQGQGRNQRRRGIWVAAFLGFASQAQAVDATRSFDQYATRQWAEADGLPQTSVLAIARTPDGYLWLATEGGLVRFDGVKLTTFDRRNQGNLQSTNILALGVDAKGTLWVGTTGGLHRFVGGNLEPVPLEANPSRSTGVTAIAFAGDDVLVGTDGGLFRVRNGQGTKLVLPGLADQQVSAVALSGGQVFVGTPNGLFAVDGAVVRDITAQVGLPFRDVRALAVLQDGDVVVGGRGKFTRLGAQRIVVGALEGMPPEPVTSFIEDGQGTLWIGTDGGGLVRLSGRTVARFTTRDGLADDHVRALFDDDRGGLWIGTSGGGLQRAFSGPAVTFGAVNGLMTPDVRAVFGTRSGEFLVGTEGGGLFRKEGNTFVQDARIMARTIYGFAENDRGTVYVMSREAGVLVVPASKHEAVASLEGTDELRVRSLALGADGSPDWLGTHGSGVMHREGASFKTMFPEVISPGLIVFFVQRAADGVLVGTRSGFFHVTEAKAERVALPIPNDASVLHRRVDANGDEWLGTSSGIVWHHGGAYTLIDARAGLLDEQIYATVEQPAGTVWVATNRGVLRVMRTDLEAIARGSLRVVPSRAFGLADGFRTLESNAGDPSVFVDALGAVWFGTTQGLTRIEPGKVTRSSEPPVTRLEEVTLDRLVQNARGSVRFTSGRHDLSLVFTAFDYAAPEAVTFAHRLEGLDSEWIDDGRKRDANYTDLRPGHYRFLLRACSIDGACGEASSLLDIVVEPRWFERRIVWGFIAAAAVAGGWVAARARIRALHRRARELESRVDERTVELRAAIHAVEVKDRMLHADIEEAARFQSIALRIDLETDSLGLGLKSMPASFVGGDLVDAFELSEGHFRFLMADTTGHGVQAALRTMVLKTEYEAIKWQQEWPHALIASLNDVLAANFPDLELRSTAVCFDLVRMTNGGWELRVANAAAPELFLLTGPDLVEIYQPGSFLAMMHGATFTMKRQMLPVGGRLVVFTDGLFEQEGPSGSFGHERIEAFVKAHKGSAQELAHDLGEAVKTYAARHELDDDVTVLVIDLRA